MPQLTVVYRKTRTLGNPWSWPFQGLMTWWPWWNLLVKGVLCLNVTWKELTSRFLSIQGIYNCWVIPGRGNSILMQFWPWARAQQPLCCQHVTNLISHICRQQGLSIVNYLDDFRGAATWSDAQKAFDTPGQVLSLAGLTEATDKVCPTVSVMTFLGVQFDTQNLTITITPDRLLEIQSLLAQWAKKNKSTRYEPQSLLGKVFLQGCLREICFLAALHEFELQARQLSGVQNRVADLCSCLHLSANHAALFHKENLLWQLQQREVPPDYFKFLHSW